MAALLMRVCQERKAKLKQVINEALRQGLRQTAEQPRRSKRYRTEPGWLGRCLLGNLDDVSETLAIAEGAPFL